VGAVPREEADAPRVQSADRSTAADSVKRPDRWAAEPAELDAYRPPEAKHRAERKSWWRRVVDRWIEYRSHFDMPE
jgi:hypothetical protein